MHIDFAQKSAFNQFINFQSVHDALFFSSDLSPLLWNIQYLKLWSLASA